MMRHLYCILLFVFFSIGLIIISHEEQPGFQDNENQAGIAVEYTVSDCSFVASTDNTSPARHYSLFNDENKGYQTINVRCSNSLYTHSHVTPKFLAFKLCLPGGQLQHLLPDWLPIKQNLNLSFTPSAIRYSCGYYIYALAHILI